MQNTHVSYNNCVVAGLVSLDAMLLIAFTYSGMHARRAQRLDYTKPLDFLRTCTDL